MSALLPIPLASAEGATGGLRRWGCTARGRWPEDRRDVTRCQEYKAGDKGDGGHICDS